MAGLSELGFEPKTFEEIQSDVKARLRTYFGTGTETDTDSTVMNLVNPLLIEIEEGWEGASEVYGVMNPNAAEGAALDNIGSITNTPRLEGEQSTVLMEAEGTEGASIPQYFKRSVQDSGAIFQTTEAHELPEVGSQPYEFTMTALEDGPIAAIAGTVTIGSLPSGVTTMTNSEDAEVGSYDETDEEYRVARPTRLSAIAGGTVVSIRNALLTIDDVTAATVFENDTDYTDDEGLPPHSIRPLVLGGDDQDIWDMLGVKKGAGTYTYGSEVGTYTDPVDDQEFTMRFDRVTSIDIYVAVDITEIDDNYPATGDQDIEDAILALTWDVGEDIILPRLQNAVTSVSGIVEYTLYFDTSSSPSTDTTITIGNTEQGDFDSSRITVTSP